MLGKGKVALFSLLVCLTTMPTVFAEDSGEVIEEFTLDKISVTATRTTKRGLDIPASVHVYTQEELKATGATSVIEALRFSEGLVYHSQGPAGQSLGSMTSKIVVRGQDRGTLVLLDGVPLNLRGGVSMENIPLEIVDRIEVVKGNGSVLYGGSTTGGVINIITKKKFDKSMNFSMGNYGKKNTGFTMQEGKLSIAYNHSRLGRVENYGESFGATPARRLHYTLDKSIKDTVYWNFEINKNWSVSQMYSKNRYNRETSRKDTGLVSAKNRYNSYFNNIILKYQDETFSGNFYSVSRSLYNDTFNALGVKTATSRNKDSVLGLNTQKRFDLSKGNIITGFDVQRESLNSSRRYQRNNYSVFAQWSIPFDSKWEMNLGVRATWTGGAANDHNYSNFSPQVQFLYKATKNTSYYTSIAKSFIMPNLNQMYGTASIIGNPNIKPQTGYQFEIGVKHTKNIHSWKAAIFYLDIKDYITPVTLMGTADTYYINEDRRNMGIELSYDVKLKNGFGFNTGIVYSKPIKREFNAATGTTSNWADQYGRYQLNFGINYKKDKWSASLYGNFLGNRTIVDDGDRKHPQPLFDTGMRIAYKPSEKHEIFLNLNNLLDRHGTTTHTATSSAFYQTGRNFEIGYRVTF